MPSKLRLEIPPTDTYNLTLMLGALATLLTMPLSPPKAELRGVWLTTTANDALQTPAKTESTLRRLKDIGLNTVYVEVWKNGYTQFPSRALSAVTGVDRHPNLGKSRDLLDETLREAHRNGLTYIAWFEYGFMAAHEGTQNELLEKRRHWMTATSDGSLISEQNPFVWMNPSRPECQEFLLKLIKEAVRNYPIDGIQLDDRIAWPTSMGYDPFTVAAYARAHEGASPPQNAKDPAWVRWRAERVTEFAERLSRELKAIRPNLIVSISPAVYPWSLENYACDWPKWLRNGWMTEFVPQVYRKAAADFARDWKSQFELFENPGSRLAAGVMVDGSQGTVPWEDVRANLDLLAQTESGHVFWFSRSLLQSHAESLRAYYRSRGPARNPHMGGTVGLGR